MSDEIPTAYSGWTDRYRGMELMVDGEKLRISSVRPMTLTTIPVWREPWWSRTLAYGIAAYYAIRRRL